jgi:pyrrolidone-carboxylate peptidase
MKSILIYTLPTYSHLDQIERSGIAVFVLDQKLKKGIKALERKLSRGDYYFILGIADNKGKSRIESKAVNIFNSRKKVISDGPEEYRMFCPDKEDRKNILPGIEKNGVYTTSFCNYTMYSIQHYLSVNEIDLFHMFVHLNSDDIVSIQNYLYEIDRPSSPMLIMKRARAWRRSYELMEPKLKEDKEYVELWFVGVYCIIQALELYLKAYIVFKNEKYLRMDLIRKDFRHDIKKMIKEIEKYGPEELHQNLLATYRDLPTDGNGRIKNFTELRYGRSGDITSFGNANSIENYSKDFVKVFDYIDKEIDENFLKYYNQHLKRDR